MLDLTGESPVLLRPGGVPVEDIEALAGPVRRIADATLPRSPGMLASHYAPSTALRLDARDVGPDEALLAFGPPLPGAYAVFNLSAGCDVNEAASRFFTGLRELDKIVGLHGLTRIASMTVPRTGLGLAINDRLRRAAAPR